MSGPSGLSPTHAAQVRTLVANGAAMLVAHKDAVHYTEGPQRWSAIAQRKLVARGQMLTEGDCSSTATWLLWNGLSHLFGVRDVVNDASWTGGYTGTMLNHGVLVRHEADVKVGDLALYGSGPPGQHVAVCLGGGMVFSHGSEAGPFKLALHYRPDLMEIRRYI